MSSLCTNSEYFSGQGSILIAQRDIGGNALGFREVGNISAANIALETTVFSHQENCSGLRTTDKELVQSVSGTLAFTMESLNRENLALAMYATDTVIAAASVADEEVTGYFDLWTSLANVDVSNVIVGDDAVPTTTYVEGVDYHLDAKSGAILVLSTGAITDMQNLFIDYDHSAQENIAGLTSSSAPEVWVRFAGLNTADTNKPVIIDVFKASVQPLAALELINEEFASLEMTTTILTDITKTSGSTFFNVRRVA